MRRDNDDRQLGRNGADGAWECWLFFHPDDPRIRGFIPISTVIELNSWL